MRVYTLSDMRSKKKLRVYTASEAKGLKRIHFICSKIYVMTVCSKYFHRMFYFIINVSYHQKRTIFQPLMCFSDLVHVQEHQVGAVGEVAQIVGHWSSLQTVLATHEMTPRRKLR